MIEREQSRERCAIVGVELSGNTDRRGGGTRRLARALCIQSQTHRPDRSREVELGQRGGIAGSLEAQNGMNLCQRKSIGERTERVRSLRRDAAQRFSEPGKRSGVEVDGEAPTRLRR